MSKSINHLINDLHRVFSRHLNTASGYDDMVKEESGAYRVTRLTKQRYRLTRYVKRSDTLTMLDDEGVEELVKQAARQPDARLTLDTYLAYPLVEKYAPYRSMLLRHGNQIVLSRESVSQLMEQVFHRYHMPYEAQRGYANALMGQTYRTPYTMEDLILLPIPGPTRHQTAWIAMHDVIQFEMDDVNDVIVTMSEGERLKLPMSYTSFVNRLQRTAQHYQMSTFFTPQPYDSLKRRMRKQLADQSNVVTEYLRETHIGLPTAQTREIIRAIISDTHVLMALEKMKEDGRTVEDAINLLQDRIQSNRDLMI